MSIKSAFNTILSLRSYPVTLTRPGQSPISIKIADSNYFRNLAGPGETAIEGKEFVISKEQLDAHNFGAPKRGDRITETDVGTDVISEIRPMRVLGGELVGYRVRTS